MAEIEIDAIPDGERRQRVRALLPEESDKIELTPAVFERAAVLERLGFKAADAIHVASAEAGKADVLLTCDDRLLRTADRHGPRLKVPVANPLDWIKEIPDAQNA